MTEADAVLEAEELVVERTGQDGATRLLDGVSLSLRAARILGVVGESGAGKSLTGAALINLLDPPLLLQSGHLRFRGEAVSATAPLRRGRDVSMVFQDPLTALNPLFTIGHQLTETIRIHHGGSQKDAEARALALLVEVGLSAPRDRLHQYPHELSGGMRQRVVIALALAPDPSVLVADEPTTALDVSVQAQIISLIRRLCDERGMAVMLITHDIGVVAEAADEVAVMYAGRVVETGPVADVLTNPSHPYTRGLLASTLEISERTEFLAQIDGAAPRPGHWPSGCRFHPRCPDQSAICHSDIPSLVASGSVSIACWNRAHG
jgi:peptide/nickel transport system ATP-binding protein